MKQIIIGQNKAYSSIANSYDLTKIPEGVIGFYDLKTQERITSAPTNNFCIVCGRGEDKMPICLSEVDVKSLSVEYANHEAGTKFSAKITIPTPTKGQIYTVVVVKKGVVFNERNSWSASALAMGTVAADVASEIVRQLNANTINLGIKASNVGGAITLNGVEEGADYEVYGADALMGADITDKVVAKKAILDKAYVQDLASRCASEKGFNDVLIDGTSILPGYPEIVDSNEYEMFTLRFAVPRVAAKQRDEVVWQLVHICVPVGAACINTIKTILGIQVNQDKPNTEQPGVTSL